MKQYNLCFLGFGKVGRALARLLAAKSSELREAYGFEYRITGVASRSIGWQAKPDGFEPANLASSSQTLQTDSSANEINEWLQETKPDVVFETTSLNPDSGQPAIDYLRAVLKSGAHAITANKGVLVYGFQELNQLALAGGKHFLLNQRCSTVRPSFHSSVRLCPQ